MLTLVRNVTFYLYKYYRYCIIIILTTLFSTSSIKHWFSVHFSPRVGLEDHLVGSCDQSGG